MSCATQMKYRSLTVGANICPGGISSKSVGKSVAKLKLLLLMLQLSQCLNI